MDIQEQPKLRFHGVDIVKVDFSSQSRYDPDKKALKIHTDAKVFYPKDSPRQFNILMDVSVIASSYFNLRLHTIGTFECTADIDEEMKKHFVNVNAPAIMFPYIRSFITTFTSSLGNVTNPIIIPVRFFKGELEEILLKDELATSKSIE